LELRQLRYVLALAEARNYLRAAEALHISQSALSRGIQSLETTLGVTLFDRSKRQVEPTQFGRLLIEHARTLDLASRDLDRDLALARDLELGELSIGAGPYGGAALVAKAVGRLCARHPKLRTSVVIGPYEEFPDRLRAREIDLMVIDVRAIRGKAEFELRELAAHPSVVVCRPGHPLLQYSQPDLAQVFRYPFIGPRMAPEDLEALLQLAPPAVRAVLPARGLLAVTSDSLPVLKAVVQNSDAICLMSVFMAADELHAGTLAAIPQLDFARRATFGVAWLRGRTLSLPGRAFLQLLLEHDAELLEVEKSLAR
jgi:DNA-binding transcriptional LysR family regulator